MIKICGILQSLQEVIGEGKDRDMFLVTWWACFFYCHLVYINHILSEGGKSIEYFLSHVRKTYGLRGLYGLEDVSDGKERVEHLQAIYASLVSKGVPNVDRLKKSEILHDVRGSYVDLEPRGISEGPNSFFDVRNAVVCILEALKVQ